jgi:alkanesulfonate monooxygenase
MPVRLIGMIGVAPPHGATVHVIKGGISPAYLSDFALAHERAGFDMVLVGYTSSSAEGFNVAMYAAMRTERLAYLIAHRPGLVAPTLAARKVATFDVLTGGRMALHIIAGLSDEEQQSEGDFLLKQDRYRRGSEYLEIMRRAWTSEAPFDFSGSFYQVRGAISDVKPYQKPYPPIFFGGSSEGALAMGAEHCDVFALFGEPLAETRERVADFRRRAAAFGRSPRFNISLRPIVAEREDAAWDKARGILREIQRGGPPSHPIDQSGQRLMALAARADVHDERLWMPIASATGALGNTSCLVGTPEQVAGAILKYYRLGVASFLIRGFDPYNDTIDFGRELIPRIRSGVAEIDREAPAAA